MNETLTVLSARVDAMPLLLPHMARRGGQPLLDPHFPTHGNWQGLSPGWVSVIWVTHILSPADHRLTHVEPFVLQALRDDGRWGTFERALPQQVVRVYALWPERGRLDSTAASGAWAVTPEGLCQLGPSKDHCPDLPQGTVMLSPLDSLGLLLATTVVPGRHADDPLYTPAVRQVRASLGWSARIMAPA